MNITLNMTVTIRFQRYITESLEKCTLHCGQHNSKGTLLATNISWHISNTFIKHHNTLIHFQMKTDDWAVHVQSCKNFEEIAKLKQ